MDIDPWIARLERIAEKLDLTVLTTHALLLRKPWLPLQIMVPLELMVISILTYRLFPPYIPYSSPTLGPTSAETFQMTFWPSAYAHSHICPSGGTFTNDTLFKPHSIFSTVGPPLPPVSAPQVNDFQTTAAAAPITDVGSFLGATSSLDYYALALFRCIMLLLLSHTSLLREPPKSPAKKKKPIRRRRYRRANYKDDKKSSASQWYQLMPAVSWLCNYTYTLGRLLVQSECSADSGHAAADEWGGIRRLETWLLAGWNLAAGTALYAVWCYYPQQGFGEAVKREIDNYHYSEKTSADTKDEDGSGASEKDEKEDDDEWGDLFDYEAYDDEEEEKDDDNEEDVAGKKGKTKIRFTEKAVMQLRMLLSYNLPYWKYSVASASTLFVASWVSIHSPYYDGLVTSSIITQIHSPEGGQPATTASERIGYDAFLHATAVLAAISIFTSILQKIEGHYFSNVPARIARHAKRDVYSAVLRQELAFLETTGRYVAYDMYGCEEIGKISFSEVNQIVHNGIMFVGALVAMLNISWQLTLLSLALIPVTRCGSDWRWAWQNRWKSREMRRSYPEQRVINQAIGDIRTVKMFGCEEFESKRYAKLSRALDDVPSKGLFESGKKQLIEWFGAGMDNVLRFTTLLYGAKLIAEGRFGPAAIVTFQIFQGELVRYYNSWSNQYSGIVKRLQFTWKICRMLHRQPRVRLDGTVVKAPHECKGHIEYRSVSFAYPSRPGIKVLDEVSFEARAGETVALVGHSGAGKSTVVTLLMRLYEPNEGEGEIMLDGVPLADYDHHFYHSQVTLVPQEPSLYSGSIRYNILYGYRRHEGETKAEVEARMVEAARQAGIHSFIESCPRGYSTQCGQRGVQMSGGQKQRIGIARALVREPRVLVLDEATSALDTESEYEIREAIHRASVGRTVIVIAHRLATVMGANRILVFKQGRIVEAGTHAKLLSNNTGIYSHMVRRQQLFSADEALLSDADKGSMTKNEE